MAERSARNARIASVIAATAIALACGTNYAYSAWAPDFAKRLELSATQSNIIGAAGNIGAYGVGIPAGYLIDNRGTRIAVLVGAVALACGYFPIHTAYDSGPHAMGVGLISFCSFLTGAGSCTAFSAAIKTCAYNWPNNRGTATAFPLSAFGLSAFFFTTIAHVFLGESVSNFLLMLAAGTLILNVSAFSFLRLIPSTPTYVPVQADEASNHISHFTKLRRRSPSTDDPSAFDQDVDETSSLTSRPSLDAAAALTTGDIGALHGLEMTGTALLGTLDFWALFLLLSLLAGVGLMTINNIGNDAGALWKHFAPDTTRVFVRQREQMHVAILSLMSFVGRLLSGIGSDYLITQLHASRFWCLVVSAIIFTVAQALALLISNPYYLFLVSSLTGLAYGALFGVYPALVADTFGVTGLSLNWGFMIFAPVISGNVYNVVYGRIADANGGPECSRGLQCYGNAYWLTLLSSIAGVVGALWCVRYEGMQKARRTRGGREA